ncbi:putative dihydrodipicolinate reductase, domain protein [Mycobacterium xenopi 4042]|uniref:Putative dihydrodipicolinate reductase, domain protein n=1 Tax=Mycobacterium xenopi 4042 TaxID=1299334 RepID=X8AF44_MYCXE|nr:putative dihydrodipicolinate reductase, domain protein [Mycobacterium xenopi 4042]
MASDPEELIAPLEEAARQGNASLFVNGIDPGFANDLLPLALAGTCQSIQQVRCMEIVDYATYDSAVVMFDVMGFGKPLDDTPMLLQPGVLSMAWARWCASLPPGWASRSTRSPSTTRGNRRPKTSTLPAAISPRAAPQRCALRCSAWPAASPQWCSNT